MREKQVPLTTCYYTCSVCKPRDRVMLLENAPICEFHFYLVFLLLVLGAALFIIIRFKLGMLIVSE